MLTLVQFACAVYPHLCVVCGCGCVGAFVYVGWGGGQVFVSIWGGGCAHMWVCTSASHAL